MTAANGTFRSCNQQAVTVEMALASEKLRRGPANGDSGRTKRQEEEAAALTVTKTAVQRAMAAVAAKRVKSNNHRR